MKIFQCDKCGTTSTPKDHLILPENWLSVQFNVRRQGATAHFVRTPESLDLCPNCWERLGIILEDGRQTSQDQLYDIVAELVDEAINDR